MKTLSRFLSVAVIASASLFAGGGFVPTPQPDVEPVEPAVAEIPATEPASEIKPYIGGALGTSTADVSSQAVVCGGCQYDKLNQTTSKAPDKLLKWGGSGSATTMTGLAGVEINDYIAVEGRLTKAVSDYEIKDHKPISMLNAALYLKPQYKFEDFSVYALLGYGLTSVDFMDQNTKVHGFQYGGGASYDLNDQVSLFADYTKLVGQSKKISEATTLKSIDNVSAGVIYRP
ncbi:MAG TPA: porin family protein [Nitratifractor sp.]|nr:porin family protein [Nitratifractor sp.]